MVARRLSKSAENLPDDPAELQAENAKVSAILRVHDQLVQAPRLLIARLQKLAFSKYSEKIKRETEQLELVLEDLLVAMAEGDKASIDKGQDEPSSESADAPALRRGARVSDATRASVASWTSVPAALTAPLGILLCNSLPGKGRRFACGW